jgi:hypothetical protein
MSGYANFNIYNCIARRHTCGMEPIRLLLDNVCHVPVVGNFLQGRRDWKRSYNALTPHRNTHG